MRAGRAAYRAGRPQYTNRIHRDDCAGVLEHLIGLDDAPSVLLAVDDDPAPERVVLEWLAGALGAPQPRPSEGGSIVRSGRGNKRCRNDRLRATGYKFLYPTFREGYASLIEEQR